MNLAPASPATTNCSDLDYLIALQSEEIYGSQLRRSQRLWEKEKVKTAVEAAKDENPLPHNNGTVHVAGSPPLFVESDEEFSQLGQLPPKDIPQIVAIKREIKKTSMDEGPKKKRNRPSEVRSRSRGGKRPAATRKPTTLSSKLKLKTMPIKPQVTIMDSPLKVDKINNFQHSYKQHTIVIPSDSNSSVVEIDSSPGKQPETVKNRTNMAQTRKVPFPQLKEPQIQTCNQTATTSAHANVGNTQFHSAMSWKYRCYQAAVNPTDSKPTKKCQPGKQSEAMQHLIATTSGPPTKIALPNPQLTETNIKMFEQSKLQSRKSIYSASGTKRGRPKKQTDDVKSPRAKSTEPQLKTTSHVNAESPQVYSAVSCQYSYQQPGVNPTDTKSSSLIANATQTNPCQGINLTQTLLPERYPAHFIHQLPPESTTSNGVILSSELQRVGSSNTAPAMPASELRQMCPTPDTTPTIAHETYSPSPPNVESTISTTPSLTDSLAEIFGTRKVRNILNIEPPRKYLVLEVHLPAIAFLLDVDLGRLRAVLKMTQRLTLEQMQEMVQEDGEVISIHSQSDEEDVM